MAFYRVTVMVDTVEEIDAGQRLGKALLALDKASGEIDFPAYIERVELVEDDTSGLEPQLLEMTRPPTEGSLMQHSSNP